MAIKLSLTDVIRGPVVTVKASALVNDLKKVVLEVHPMATKPLIAEAIEKLFNVQVARVNIDVRKGKIRTVKRIKTRGALTKRAIVTLKDSHSFDKLAQAGSGAFSAEPVSTDAQ